MGEELKAGDDAFEVVPKERICPHCGMDKDVRNPSGYCDHLYYPDNCEICQDIEAGKPPPEKKEVKPIGDERKDGRCSTCYMRGDCTYLKRGEDCQKNKVIPMNELEPEQAEPKEVIQAEGGDDKIKQLLNKFHCADCLHSKLEGEDDEEVEWICTSNGCEFADNIRSLLKSRDEELIGEIEKKQDITNSKGSTFWNHALLQAIEIIRKKMEVLK